MKIRPIRLVLTMVLLCLLHSGCQAAEENYICKVGDEEIPVGVYIYWQVLATREAIDHLPDGTALDAAIWRQNIGGIPVEDWINAEARADLLRQVGAEALFDKMGLAIDLEARADLDSWVEGEWRAISAAHEKSGIAKSSFYRVNESIQKQRLLFLLLYGEDGSEALSTQEIQAYFRADYARFTYLHYVKSGDSTGSPDAAKNSVMRTEAAGYYDRARAGEDFYSLLDERNGTTGQDYSDFYYMTTRDTFVDYPAELIEQVFDTPIGEVGLCETETYIFVFLRQDPMTNPEDYAALEFNLRYSLRGEVFEQMLTQKAASLSITISERSLKKYRPSNINLGSI